MVTDPPDDVDDGARVVDAESSRGRTVLVVGDVPAAATEVAHRRLFGDAAHHRLQMLVTTRAAGQRNPVRPSVETIHYRLEPPTTTAAVQTDGSEIVDGRLTTLGWTVSKRILDFRQLVDETIDVRLCVDSLLDLLAEYDREAVFRLVNMMAGQLRNVGGTGQFHLPMPWDADEAVRLAPLFDAVMEVSAVDDRYEYRWRLGEGSAEWRTL